MARRAARLVPSPAELVRIRTAPSTSLDVYSGVARLSGSVWASRYRAARRSRTAVVVVHPSSNFLGHYLLEPLAAAGVDAIGLTTRYVANDSMLLMENCVLDVGAAVAHLRAEGYRHVALLGNSGGGGLVAMYQSQAEAPTISSTPAGDPPDLTTATLPPVDALIPMMAHPGRAIVYTESLDPAIGDERDPFTRDRALDMFDPANGPPYPPDFVDRYRQGQLARSRRITEWVWDRLRTLSERSDLHVTDLPFVVHGTVADPRFTDPEIEPSDRLPGTPWGPPAAANLSPATLGHHTSLRSWLSQWSVDHSHCDGPAHLARTSVPVLVVYGTADQVVFPSHAEAFVSAAPDGRVTVVALPGADHYFQSYPEAVPRAATTIVDWLDGEGLVA